MAGRVGSLRRSLVAVSLLVASAAGAAVGMAVAPVGAADNVFDVYVHETFFTPARVEVGPGDIVRFILDAGVGTDHTVTLTDCGNHPAQLCEKGFDDPRNPPWFRWSSPNTYAYYDRLAAERGVDMRGEMVVTEVPTTTSTTPPTTTTTTLPATTTTTRPATTTTTRPPATTTTTAAQSIRPLAVADPPAPTTTTTAPAAGPVAPAGKVGKAGGEATTSTGKDRGRAAAPLTPTTAAPAPPGPPEEIFDPESLTPAPLPPPGPAVPSDPGRGDAEAAGPGGGPLKPDRPVDDGSGLLLVALAVSAVFVGAGGAWRWYQRSSRYFPA